MESAEDFLSDECGMISDSDLGTLCWKMADLANVYWRNEQGSDSWLDVDDVIDGSIGSKRRDTSDYHKTAYAAIASLIQSAMSDDKYTLGIVRYVNPNQLHLDFTQSTITIDIATGVQSTINALNEANNQGAN